MDDKTLQRKLNQMAKLGMELNEEAKRRYPHPDAGLFHEADGTLNIMSGDAHPDTRTIGERSSFIEFSAKGVALWGAGAW